MKTLLKTGKMRKIRKMGKTVEIVGTGETMEIVEIGNSGKNRGNKDEKSPFPCFDGATPRNNGSHRDFCAF